MKYDFILPYKSFTAFFANDPQNFILKDTYCIYEHYKQHKVKLNIKKKSKDVKRYKIGFNFFDTIRYIFSKWSLEQYRFKYHNQSYNNFIKAMHEAVQNNKEKYKIETEGAIDKIYKDKENTIERLKKAKANISHSKYNEIVRQFGDFLPNITESQSKNLNTSIITLENKKQKRYHFKITKNVSTINMQTYMNINGKTYQVNHNNSNNHSNNIYSNHLHNKVLGAIDDSYLLSGLKRYSSAHLKNRYE